MQKLLQKLRVDYPAITFKPATVFYWSPKEQIVYYATNPKDRTIACWSLLHELSHALLNHNTYTSDFELVSLESLAWKHAKTLAKAYEISINEDHIQDCLDTYRDWLHKRSTCPSCGMHSLQKDSKTYGCINCGTVWHVTTSRFCRAYRRKAIK